MGGIVAGCATIAPIAAPCAGTVGAVVGIIFTTMLVWEQLAYHQRPSSGSGPARLLDGGDAPFTIDSVYDPSKDIFGIDAPEMVTIERGGYTTTFTRSSAHVGRSLFSRDDLNDSHSYFEVKSVNDATGEEQHSFADIELETGHGVVSSKIGATADGLDKRQSPEDFTAHYSFDDMQERARDYMPMDEEEAERVGHALWVIKHDNDVGNPCLNIGADGSAFNRGYFQLSSGSFNDQLRNCPGP